LAGILLLALLEAAEAQPRRILLLHSYGPHFRPWTIIAAQFREDLLKQSPYGIDLYDAYLQSERFEPSHEQGLFLDYLRALFVEHRFDLVVAMGAPAARLFLENRPQMFPSTPLLITGADERTFSDIAFTSNDTAVASDFDQAKPVEHILQVLPNTTKIALVIGASPIDKFWAAVYRRELQPLTNRVLFDWFDELSAEEMVARVATLPPHSAIFYAHVHVDAGGVPQEDDRVLSRLWEAASAPIFGWIDTNFGRGIVGGPLLSTEELAHRSAVVAIRILGGEIPGNIKTPTLGLSAPKYDWRELQRWHISEAVLPPGREIYFRGPSAWEQYRGQIVAGLAAILAQAALIGWLLYERRRRRFAEVAARQTKSDLEHVDRMATAAQLSASIAHEVNQPLAGMVSHANAGIRWLTATTPDLGRVEASLKQIVAAGHHAGDVIASVRALFKRGAEERVDVQINQLIRDALSLERIELERWQVSLRLQLAEQLPDVIGDRVQLLQVILNLIRNAIEAMAVDGQRTLGIRSQIDGAGDVLVSVEDSGTGIDKQNLDRIFDSLFTTKQQGMGMGLSICKSIIESHHGRLWAMSAMGEGSTFFIKLPRYKAGDGWRSPGPKS
jgi:signal transduction histidine kinase